MAPSGTKHTATRSRGQIREGAGWRWLGAEVESHAPAAAGGATPIAPRVRAQGSAGPAAVAAAMVRSPRYRSQFRLGGDSRYT
jgi:hypothetical protein